MLRHDDDTAAIVVLRLQGGTDSVGAEVEILHIIHDRACKFGVSDSLIGAMDYFCGRLRSDELDDRPGPAASLRRPN